MKLNIKTIKFKNLSGEKLLIDNTELGKTLGNYLYTTQPDLGWLQIAQSLYAGDECELTEAECQNLISVISAPECGLIIAVKKSIIESLKTIKNESETSK